MGRNEGVSMNKRTEERVFIEVYGGIAHLTHKTENVKVFIKDHDNRDKEFCQMDGNIGETVEPDGVYEGETVFYYKNND